MSKIPSVTGLGGFRTGTSRYSEQILASTSWRITLSGTKLGKVEKCLRGKPTRKKKKTKKRERDRHSHELNPLSAGIFH